MPSERPLILMTPSSREENRRAEERRSRMTHKNLMIACTAVVAVGLALTSPNRAEAQFSKEVLKCRATVSKSISKLSTTAAKTIVGCHKNRDKGKVDVGVDCNDLAQADTKSKVQKAEDKARELIPSKCVDISVDEAGFAVCGAPCEVAVPAVGNFSDVASCLVCQAKTAAESATGNAQGGPAATPLSDKDEAKCHGTVGKAGLKYFSSILKERLKCQSSAEKEGTTSSEACRNAAIGKLTTARTKAIDGILPKCEGVNLDNLNTCSNDLQTMATCVVDEDETQGIALFDAIAEFTALPPATWTEVFGIFQASSCGNQSCHGASQSGQFGGFSDSSAVYADLVGVASICNGTSFATRVVASDPDNSFLLAKLAGTHDCGSRMPIIGGALSDAEVARVASWILDGAQEN